VILSSIRLSLALGYDFRPTLHAAALSLGSVLCQWVLLVLISFTAMPQQAQALEPNCGSDSRIAEAFDNGARWDMCWESRVRENLVLTDIIYTPPSGDAFRLLSSARLSQLHVAYDDSDVTYNDVTQYGLGGGYLLNLTTSDCPQGNLLEVQTRPAVCVWRDEGANGYRTATRSRQSESLNLFSVSQVGAYAYITSWTFYDDGAIEPGIGATGALQRSSNNTELPFGRVLQGDPETLWLSHTHNYYWRLDFDLGEAADDDVFSEQQFLLAGDGTREQSTTVFSTEQARQINPETQQIWQIAENKHDDARAYMIEPVRSGHRFERKEVEPYTDFDLFVTVANDCERFASQNARFNPDCANDVLQFVDGQSIENEDIVLWHRVAFHHVPRSEDQRHMHTHWDGFVIEPRNLLAGTGTLNDLPNNAPVFNALPALDSDINEHVHRSIIAVDVDQDVLSYSSSGLPQGVSIDSRGQLHGKTQTAGVYTVTITAQDDHTSTTDSFEWTVAGTTSTKSRSGYAIHLLLLMLGGLLIRPAHKS
jgi:primary-amine oxidase